jgi:endonuclease/exonuclease/phosphatase family metal-dependent hydrolase
VRPHNSRHSDLTRRRAQWVRAQKAGYVTLRRVVRALLVWGPPVSLLAICLVGFLSRLLVQDRGSEFIADCYYVTPPIVLSGLVLAAGLSWLIARRWRLAAATLAAGVGFLIWAYPYTWYDRAAAPAPTGSQRVLFWNVAHGVAGWTDIAAQLRARDPDIIGLVESVRELPRLGHDLAAVRAELQQTASEMQVFWSEQMPQYHAIVLSYGISLLTKGELTQVEDGYLAPNERTAQGHYLHGQLATPTRTLHVIVVDVAYMPGTSRSGPFRDLNQLLATLDGEPVLLIGDFNTPTDSVFVEPLRARFLNAFEWAGQGYVATWPIPLPVLAIDQAWFNAGVRVTRCVHGWSWASDHRSVELDISVAP